jgi:hypothetical protein
VIRGSPHQKEIHMTNTTPRHRIDLVIGALRTGALDNDAAETTLAKLSSASLAAALVDVVSRAEGARALFCDTDGLVNGEDPGWFDVEGYSTKERWEGPELNDGGLDGFTTLQHAIDYANSGAMAGFYEVVISAYGEHKDYEPGERVWSMFKRPYAGDA